jgi:hypothetical protein
MLYCLCGFLPLSVLSTPQDAMATCLGLECEVDASLSLTANMAFCCSISCTSSINIGSYLPVFANITQLELGKECVHLPVVDFPGCSGIVENPGQTTCTDYTATCSFPNNLFTNSPYSCPTAFTTTVEAPSNLQVPTIRPTAAATNAPANTGAGAGSATANAGASAGGLTAATTPKNAATVTQVSGTAVIPRFSFKGWGFISGVLSLGGCW